MKILGVLMIIVSGVGLGVVLQTKEQLKLKKIQALLVMLNETKNKMKCTLFSTKEIFFSLSENPQYASLEFLNKCTLFLKNGFDFPNSFEKAVKESDSDLPEKVKEMLISLKHYLGTTDLEGQLSYIDLFISYLQNEWEDLSQKRLKKGNMYVSLGLLAGTLIAVALY